MNLNNLQPAFGSKQANVELDAVSVVAWVRLLVVVTRARSREPAVFTESVSKAVRCLCSAGCRNVVSNRHLH